MRMVNTPREVVQTRGSTPFGPAYCFAGRKQRPDLPRRIFGVEWPGSAGRHLMCRGDRVVTRDVRVMLVCWLEKEEARLLFEAGLLSFTSVSWPRGGRRAPP